MKVKGENFRLPIDGKVRHVDFLTTRWVRAATPEEAEMKVVQLLKRDELLLTTQFMPESPPMLYVTDIIDLGPDAEHEEGSGFSFLLKD